MLLQRFLLLRSQLQIWMPRKHYDLAVAWLGQDKSSAACSGCQEWGAVSRLAADAALA